MADSLTLLCKEAINTMHDLVASERINIQEIDASQGYFLDRGAPIPGRFSGLDNINSCVAITSMQFAMICVGLFTLHNWVSPVVRQLRQPNPEEYSYTDPLLAVRSRVHGLPDGK